MIALSELKYHNAYIWWFYSMITILPLIIISIYKLVNPINIHKYNDRNPFPFHLQDKLARFFLFWGPVYYFFDAIFIILKWEIGCCGFSYLVHHIVSFIFLPLVIFQNYYPWYCCLVPGVHGILLAFPEIESLNYVYLICCGLYQYGLYQEPYNNMRSYKLLQKGTWILEITLFLLWWFGCKNTF